MCFVELRHDVFTVLDKAKVVSLCVMPIKAHEEVHMVRIYAFKMSYQEEEQNSVSALYRRMQVSYLDHGKRKFIGSLRKEILGFSIEPLGSTSAKDVSIMLAIGAGAVSTSRF